MTPEEIAYKYFFRSAPEWAQLVSDIRDAERAALERAAQLHEQINPASDAERHNGDPGAGAMGAVIEYRDAIRAMIPPADTESPQ
jgi:hypothetical protein